MNMIKSVGKINIYLRKGISIMVEFETNDYTPARAKVNQINDDARSRKRRMEVPIWQKSLLTLEEAAAYTGIGMQKLREISSGDRCDFVLWNGSKRMLKRSKLEKYLENQFSI